jgi:hypothetical protein
MRSTNRPVSYMLRIYQLLMYAVPGTTQYIILWCFTSRGDSEALALTEKILMQIKNVSGAGYKSWHRGCLTSAKWPLRVRFANIQPLDGGTLS